MERLLPRTEEIVERMVKESRYYAAIYARQSNTTEKFSLEVQESLGMEYAEKNNLTIYNVYKEKVSASSKSVDERKMFQELLRDAKAGYFKTVIAARRDRIARNVEEFFDIKKEFKKLGIKLVYSNDGEYKSDESYISSFIENVIMAVAELEPEQIKMRIKLGKKKQKEERIYSGNWENKFGLRRSEKKVKKDDSAQIYYYEYYQTGESSVIKEIFRKFLDIDEAKVKDTNQAFQELKSNNPDLFNGFDNAELKEIISNPIYAGLDTKSFDYKYDRDSLSIIDREGDELEVSKEYFHRCINVIPIIENSDDWYEAANKLKRLGLAKKQTPRNSTSYLFRGMLYCSNCDGPVVLKGNKYSCKNKCINITKESLVFSILSQLLPQLLNVSTLKSAIRGFTSTLRKEVNCLKMKLTNNIIKQEKHIKRYLINPEDENNNKEFEELLIYQKSIKDEIRDREQYITYLNNEFLYSVIYLLDTNIELAVKYIINNGSERLQELLREVYKQGVYIINGTDEIIIDWDKTTKQGNSSRLHKGVKPKASDRGAVNT